jgi:hypothetical protein
VDANRFDRLSRVVGEQTNRRNMLKAAAGGTLAVVGVGALRRSALGQDVIAESRGYKGDDCFDNSDCRRGLTCSGKNSTCQYKNNCGGKKNHACQGTGQCCRGKNLVCENKRCKRDKKKKNR